VVQTSDRPTRWPLTDCGEDGSQVLKVTSVMTIPFGIRVDRAIRPTRLLSLTRSWWRRVLVFSSRASSRLILSLSLRARSSSSSIDIRG
jgi:hypothetical protein